MRVAAALGQCRCFMAQRLQQAAARREPFSAEPRKTGHDLHATEFIGEIGHHVLRGQGRCSLMSSSISSVIEIGHLFEHAITRLDLARFFLFGYLDQLRWACRTRKCRRAQARDRCSPWRRSRSRSGSGGRPAARGCRAGLRRSCSRTRPRALSILLMKMQCGAWSSSRRRSSGCSRLARSGSGSATTMVRSTAGMDIVCLAREIHRAGTVENDIAVVHEGRSRRC